MCLFPIVEVPKGGKFVASHLWFLGQDDWPAWGHWMMGYKEWTGNRWGSSVPHCSATRERKGLVFIWSLGCLLMLYFIQAINVMLEYCFAVRIFSHAFCMSLGIRKATGLVTSWGISGYAHSLMLARAITLLKLMPRPGYVVLDHLTSLCVSLLMSLHVRLWGLNELMHVKHLAPDPQWALDRY